MTAGGAPHVRLSPTQAAALSLVLPGLGQWIVGRRSRGVVLTGAAIAAVAVLAWLGSAGAWPTLVPFWLAAALDARALAAGRPPRTARLGLVAMLPLYVAAWQTADADFARVATGFPKVAPLFRALLAPDLFERERSDVVARVVVSTPCPADGSAPAPAPLDAAAPSVRLVPACAALGSTVRVEGAGFPAEREVELTWLNPSGEPLPLGPSRTDAGGRFTAEVVVPIGSIPEIYRDRIQRQRLEARVAGSPGAVRPSETLKLVMGGMGVTLATGFIATLLSALCAIPLAVLGARNLMGASRASLAVYALVRFAMNVTRAVEPVILCIVFAVWVSQGPFAGMLALTLHAVAALGKLYSEQIEDIDPGPVDAVRATGASWLQTVVYAVLPQVVPQFTAFTVYRWDINVRMSTILGFVGGGGIGFLLQQWISRADWSEAATAIVVIALVVMALDFASAAVRERIAAGRRLMRPRLKPLAALAFAGLALWSWRTLEIEPRRLVADAHKIRPIMSELLHPTLVARGHVTETARAPLEVPCGVLDAVASDPGDGRTPPGEEGDAGMSPLPADDAGPGLAPALTLETSCADVGEHVTARGEGFTGGAPGVLRWILPERGRLGAGRVTTDADGAFARDVEVRAILAGTAGAPAVVDLEAEVSRVVGRAEPSPQVRTAVDKLIETVLMALLATTFGALLALPLGFLAARNMLPRTVVGDAVYYATRTAMNLLRSVEPLILAAVFAAWVGYGAAFPGILALTVVTLANLGKLFSEAVESIDPGPLEAIEATGANRVQTVAEAVVPQVVPPFLAFGVYHWDINVRISTVIGFVGGGGIGVVLREWMNQLQWSHAAVAVLGIVVVVNAMDYLSLKARERLM